MGGRLLILVLGVVALLGSILLAWQMWRYRGLADGIAWLEPREFGTLTLVAVGTGTGSENPQRLGPATAIGLGSRVVLVDAGRGVAEALRRCAIPVQQPDTVLLTSLLPENVLGLDDLLLTGWNAPRGEPLRVVGPKGTRALTRRIASAYAAAIESLATARGVDPRGAAFDAVDVADGWTERRDGLEVRAADMGAAPLASLAYRFEREGGAIVVAGVGADPERLAEFANGAAVLAAEGFYAESVEMAIAAGASDPERLRREAALHLPLEKVGDAAARAGVGTLLLTRLSPPPLFEQQYRGVVGATYPGRVLVAAECETLTR